MLPFLKMLDMIPDTNGIQNAIAKQFRETQGSMENGKGQQAAFFEILNNLTTADSEQLKEVALELFQQEAGQVNDGQRPTGPGPHRVLSRFPFVRQLFAKFRAQEQKGLPSSEHHCPLEKQRNHGDDLAWWETVLPIPDPQAKTADTDPSASCTSFLEGSVDNVDVPRDSSEPSLDGFLAKKPSQAMDTPSTENREVITDLAPALEKIDGTVLREFSGLIEEAQTIDDRGKSIGTNSSTIEKKAAETKVLKDILPEMRPLSDRPLKQDEAIPQPKHIDAPTDVSVARTARSTSPQWTDSAVNQAHQSHGIDDRILDKRVDPKPDVTMVRHIPQQDPLAIKPDGDGQTSQWEKEGGRQNSLGSRSKTIFNEMEKLDASTASSKQAKYSTAQQPQTMQDPPKQEQPAFVQKTIEPNGVVYGEKEGIGVSAEQQDDKIVESISQKSMTDQPDRTIAKPGETDPSAPTKEERIDVIRQIVQRMTLRQWGAQSQMIIRLKPDMLGQLRMQVISENHQLAVRMTAESSTVKDLIEQNLHHLKSELNFHGLEIQKIDVTVQSENQDSRQNQDATGFEQFARRNEEDRKRRQPRQTAFEHHEDALTPASTAGNRHLTNNAGEVDYFV